MRSLIPNWLSDLLYRAASPGSTQQHSPGSSPSSTYPLEVSICGEALQMNAIATLEVHRNASTVELDTEAPFYEVTDVESAMKHEGAIPEGRYWVYRDISGRVFLQERAPSSRLFANT
ncbi:hypothetical protein ACL1HT_04455 [Corynebacterium striatum]|nr:hypothetical protein [Corynebacterium striatum]HAT6493914.1 hypothetical protein [Corynebacterium striatum]HAT6496226.1 hypothetical protein [Corynebacterium striatum]HAT6620144.1 hypothetical protein [Corynebacterium striatum]HCG3138952.1 hypothetical protein [Corynebacterium striatum]